ncbi:hypothetical protein evm_007219 [Chilo suppressalis]|nr:hypothetical protein evm_007219 [Chilo suppressalis]
MLHWKGHSAFGIRHSDVSCDSERTLAQNSPRFTKQSVCTLAIITDFVKRTRGRVMLQDGRVGGWRLTRSFKTLN